MMTESAVKRHYSYNPQSYAGVLDKIHKKVEENLKQNVLSEKAYELQTILTEIKQTARLLDKEPLTVIEQELVRQYEQLIRDTIKIENAAREATKNATGKRMNTDLVIQALFNRRSNNKKPFKTIQGADNIFEEELAALEAAIQSYYQEGPVNINSFLTGSTPGDVAAMNNMTNSLEKKIISETSKVADHLGKKMEAKQLRANKSQKVDNNGITISLDVSLDTENNKIDKLASLLKDASFTDKQYSAWNKDGLKNYTGLQLHLGNTNLYKPITGVISEVYSGVRTQRDIFFRGMQILQGTIDPPSASEKEVIIHFTHMRFMYELRGTGIIDAYGNKAVAKYIIYNDPSNTNIFVRDTASIILEEMQRNRMNLFGNITIAASRIKS